MESPQKRKSIGVLPKAKRTKTVNQRFKKEYTEKYPVITASRIGESHAFCSNEGHYWNTGAGNVDKSVIFSRIFGEINNH